MVSDSWNSLSREIIQMRKELGITSTQYLGISVSFLEPNLMAYPSGSRMKATCFILPSVSFFWKGTPSCSKRVQALPTSSTVMAMWPKPRPGSAFPLAYPLKLGSDSVPWLCVNSRIPIADQFWHCQVGYGAYLHARSECFFSAHRWVLLPRGCMRGSTMWNHWTQPLYQVSHVVIKKYIGSFFLTVVQLHPENLAPSSRRSRRPFLHELFHAHLLVKMQRCPGIPDTKHRMIELIQGP